MNTSQPVTSQPVNEPASMLPAALWWSNYGIAIFPLWWPIDGICACPNGADCSSPAKHPLTPSGFNDASNDPDTIKQWWTKWPHANIGAPTGDTFDVIDIDGGAAAWAQLTAKHGTPHHIAVAMTGRKAGGFHYYVTPGGQKTIPTGKRGLPEKIEIKGQGGYIVVPPSIHASGSTYKWIKPIDGELHGDIDYPTWYTTITTQETRPTPTPTHTAPLIDTSDKTARYGAAVLTRACDLIRNAGEGTRWVTVAQEAVPLAVRAISGGCLNKQEAIQAIQQSAQSIGLDPSEINRIPHLFDHMERQGITHPIRPADTDTNLTDWLRTLPKAELDPQYIEAANHEREHTTWWPRDLTAILAGNDPEPEPQYLQRADGRHLFYKQRVNGIIGESESGKTWLALLAATQTLALGEKVLFLDFEDTPSGAINRLKALGQTNFTNLTYIGPDENLGNTASQDLAETLTTHKPDLIVIDGFNAAMSLLGLDINSNNDATDFNQTLLKPLAATGACVIYVDHVPKSKEARGKGGIGAQAKRAMTSGAIITVDTIDPFGRGMTGRLKLTVDKDRPGHVRAHAIAAKHAGEAVLESHPDGSIKITINEADTPLSGAAVDAIKADELHTRIYEWLNSKINPQPKRAIRDGIGAGRDGVIKAIDDMAALGLIQGIKCSDGHVRYSATPVDNYGEDD